MTDTPGSDIQLDSTWRSFGGAMAVTAGASTALISLLADVSLATACGRGAVALFGVLLVVRLVATALGHTCETTDPDSQVHAKTEASSQSREAA